MGSLNFKLLNLKRQLLLVGLVTLALPWAGCQYVGSLEQGLLDRRQAVVLATAKAQAVALSFDPVWAQSELVADITADSNVVYAHPVNTAIQVDGYARDWELAPGAPLSFVPALPSLRAQIHFALQGDDLLMLMRVFDASKNYFDPTKPIDQADRVSISLGRSERSRFSYTVLTSAPGEATIVDSLSGQVLPSAPVNAVWREQSDGYYLEVRLAITDWQNDAILVSVSDRAQRRVSLTRDSGFLNVVSTHYSLIDAMAKYLASEGSQVSSIQQSVFNLGGWLLAQDGGISTHVSEELKYRPLWIRIQRWLLGDLALSAWPYQDRYFLALSSLAGDKPVFTWYEHRYLLVAQVLLPMTLPSGQRIIYVYERAFDSVDNLTRDAVSGLLGTSLIAALLAFGCLAGFAYVLSFRIRRLSLVAQQSVDQQGRLASVFEPSRRFDEIGELSRTFHMLLQKQAEHQRYLESLAQKLSHELRTPLAVIRSSLENVQLGMLEKEATPYITRAMSGVDRLSNTLRAMVDASLLEQSIAQHEVSVVDVGCLLEEVGEAYQVLYQDLGIDFDIVLDESALLANSSGDLLAQMLDKLVGNAVDFHHPGTPIVLEGVIEERFIALTVRNTGLPVTEIPLSSLLEPLVSRRAHLQSASPPQNTSPQNLGLGLYIVRLIARWHGSEVIVEQQPCSIEGLCTISFKILLPKAQVVPFDPKNSV